MKNFKQFKMSNGDEVIGEILGQEDDDIVARHCLRLFKVDVDPQTTYYTFRPWMILKEDTKEPVQINAFHIVGMCQPSGEMLEQYKYALKKLKEQTRERKVLSLDEAYDNLSKLWEQAEDDQIDEYGDYDEDNVVPLFDVDKDKLH